MTKLYENIKMLCKEQSISVKGLEVLLKFPPNTISCWRKTLPSCRKVIEVSHYFGVSIDFLLGETLERGLVKTEYSHATFRLAEYSENQRISENVADGLISLVDVMMKLEKLSG